MRTVVAGGGALAATLTGLVLLASAGSDHAEAVTASARCQADRSYAQKSQTAAEFDLAETVTVAAPTPIVVNVSAGLSATAQAGSVFSGGRTATYQFTYAAKPDCRSISIPVNPAVVQATCYHVCAGSVVTRRLPTLSIANTANVTYVAPPGPYSASNAVIITATAVAGYEFVVTDLPAGWTLVVSDSDVVSASAFYSVAFNDQPTCRVVSAEHVIPLLAHSPVAARTTIAPAVATPRAGVPTAVILTLGGLVILGGGGLCIASIDRRWFRR